MIVNAAFSKKNYYPGETVSLQAFFKSSEDCYVHSSNFSIFKSEGVSYNSCPSGNFGCTTWSVSKHYRETLVCTELSSLNLHRVGICKGMGRIKGVDGTVGYKMSFILPQSIANSSIVSQEENTHYTKYFVRFVIERSYLKKGFTKYETHISNSVFNVIKNIQPYTELYSFIPGRNHIGYSDGISCMIKCDSIRFFPGEEFSTKLVICNYTGKSIRKVSIQYTNKVTVIDTISINRGPVVSKSGWNVLSFNDKEGTCDPIFMGDAISEGRCMDFKVSIPTYFMDRSSIDAKIIEKCIIVKCYFYNLTHKYIKFVV